jgi:membrane protein YdbS with pleckstrin-like domain
MWAAFLRLVTETCAVPPQPAVPPGAPGSATVFRAAVGYFRYRLGLWILGRVLVLALVGPPLVLASLTLAREGEGEVARLVELGGYGMLGLWLLSLPLGYALRRLEWELRWYIMTDRSLRIREGVLLVREMTLTFANVQNVSVQQGPVQRLFGVADVHVQTAGGGASEPGSHEPSMHTGVLRGVADAHALRESVLDRVRRTADAGLGDPDDARRTGASEPTSLAAAVTVLERARALARVAERLGSP